MMDTPKPVCIGCGRHPEQLPECVDGAEEYAYASADAFVRHEEGTYNQTNGHFTCTDCYIRMGAPSSPQGWKAP